MALVHYDMSIIGNQIINFVLPYKTLNHGYVEASIRLSLAATNLANGFLFDTKEYCELRDPLTKQWLPVNKNEGVAGALHKKINSKDRLADAGWTNKLAVFVPKQLFRCVLLGSCEPAVELEVNRHAVERRRFCFL